MPIEVTYTVTLDDEVYEFVGNRTLDHYVGPRDDVDQTWEALLAEWLVQVDAAETNEGYVEDPAIVEVNEDEIALMGVNDAKRLNLTHLDIVADELYEITLTFRKIDNQ